MDTLTVNGREYTLIRLLGKGKGGYSWLACSEGEEVVLKQIHHEPCSYYTFGNKLEAELRDYQRLTELGIRMPRMLAVDTENERIVKEYIRGDTIYDLVCRDAVEESYFAQMRQMCEKLYPAGLNIDYFPTNFVVQDGLLYYIDYECNGFMEEWSFERWGIRYWSRTPEFMEYQKEHR